MKKDYLTPTTTEITLCCSTFFAVSGNLQSSPADPEDWEEGQTDWWNS